MIWPLGWPDHLQGPPFDLGVAEWPPLRPVGGGFGPWGWINQPQGPNIFFFDLAFEGGVMSKNVVAGHPLWPM
jgi:hypothetical protein